MGWGGERKKNCNHTLSRHVPEIFLISFPSTYIKDMETVGYIRFNNPRINKAGKGIWDYWIHPMNEHHLVNQTMALSATSSVSLNTSSFSFFMDGDSPTSLGSPFQSPVTPSVSRFFLMSNLILPWHSLRLCPLTLSLVAWEKSPTLIWLHPSLQGAVERDEVPLEPPKQP